MRAVTPRGAASSTPIAALASALRAQAAVLLTTAEAIERHAPAVEEADALVALADAPLERRTMRRLVESGELPAVRVGRRRYCRRSDLLRLVDRRRPAASEPDDAVGALDELREMGRRAGAAR